MDVVQTGSYFGDHYIKITWVSANLDSKFNHINYCN